MKKIWRAWISVGCLIVVLSASAAYGILNSVARTDIVQITDKPSRSQNPSESLPLSSSASSNGKSIKDTIPLSDSGSTGSAGKDNIAIQERVSRDTPARDTLPISDSASIQSNILHAISATDTVVIGEASSRSSSARETLDVSDIASMPISAVAELLSISDVASPSVAISDLVGIDTSPARSFFVNLADTVGMTDALSALENVMYAVIDALALADNADITVESLPAPEDEPESSRDGKGRPSPSHLVYDESYFSEHPLSRLSFRSVSIVDSDGSSFATLPAGQTIQINALVRNYQKVDQTFTFIIQVEDRQGYAVAILTSSGLIKSAETEEMRVSWTPAESGNYVMKMMIWDSIENPSLLLSPRIAKSVAIT